MTKRARRELERIVRILTHWGIPEELREQRAEEISKLLRKEGYIGEPTEPAILATLEGEL